MHASGWVEDDGKALRIAPGHMQRPRDGRYLRRRMGGSLAHLLHGHPADHPGIPGQRFMETLVSRAPVPALAVGTFGPTAWMQLSIQRGLHEDDHFGFHCFTCS